MESWSWKKHLKLPHSVVLVDSCILESSEVFWHKGFHDFKGFHTNLKLYSIRDSDLIVVS